MDTNPDLDVLRALYNGSRRLYTAFGIFLFISIFLLTILEVAFKSSMDAEEAAIEKMVNAVNVSCT